MSALGRRPLIMLLDGSNTHTLQIARELKSCLSVDILGVGSSPRAFLLRSKYPSLRAVTKSDSIEGYVEELLHLIRRYRPDFILPVGYSSVAAVDIVRSLMPACATWLPSTEVLKTCLDKAKVLEVARRIGIDTPAEYGHLLIGSSGSNGANLDMASLATVRFPLFLKGSLEAGVNLTAKIDTADDLLPKYEELKSRTTDGRVLVQEYIDGDKSTIGCAFLIHDHNVVLSFGHEELRSVPRTGGSATRIRTYLDPVLLQDSARLLHALGFDRGVALVEYKKRRPGSYALMEINPKFWASYTLASRCNYHFAAEMVGLHLGLPIKKRRQKRALEMVFPLREAGYVLGNRDSESLIASAKAMLWPPAKWDMSLYDLWLAVTPLSRFIKIATNNRLSRRHR